MYADFSQDRITEFLRELTDQPANHDTANVAETFSDDMLLAAMELRRSQKAAEAGEVFVPRAQHLIKLRRVHPADFH